MREKVRNYRLARRYFRLFEILCYAGLVADIVTFGLGFGKLGDPYARVQGAFMVVASIAGGFFLLFMIVMTQVGRAIVDTAENSREALERVGQEIPTAPAPAKPGD